MLTLHTSKIITEVHNGLARLTLNNPARHNAISLEMWQALGEAMEAFNLDPTVKVVILQGAGGKSFAAGADISEFDTKRANAEQRMDYARISQRAQDAMKGFSKPLIAMIQGYCIGGGLVIALACDVRFTTPTSRFGIPAAKLGLGYEHSGVVNLASQVGPAHAADILFSGRQFDATEAKTMGLVNFVVEDVELAQRVDEYANNIANNAPLTVKAAKASLKTYLGYGLLPTSKQAEDLISACFDSEDYSEGRNAFREKRSPNFKGC